jgi:hypothetical protein
MLDLLIHQYLVSGMMHNIAHDMSKLVHLGFPKSKVDNFLLSQNHLLLYDTQCGWNGLMQIHIIT